VPFDSWESSNQTTYGTAGNNSTVDSSDGWRTRVNGSLSGSWTTVRSTQYNASNSTGCLRWMADGDRLQRSVQQLDIGHQSSYDTAGNNTTVDSSDGWRTRVNGPERELDDRHSDPVQRQQLDRDETDGWTNTVYAGPYTTWTSVTQAIYETAGNNSTVDSTDGWRTRSTDH
jgi:hypothetical protein